MTYKKAILDKQKRIAKEMIRVMAVKLIPVSENERQTLWRLLQMYEHEQSRFTGTGWLID